MASCLCLFLSVAGDGRGHEEPGEVRCGVSELLALLNALCSPSLNSVNGFVWAQVDGPNPIIE